MSKHTDEARRMTYDDIVFWFTKTKLDRGQRAIVRELLFRLAIANQRLQVLEKAKDNDKLA